MNDDRNELSAEDAGNAMDKLDCCGLRCPLPLLRSKQRLAKLASGAVLEVIADDAGARRDIPAWLAQSPHRLLAQDERDGAFVFRIERG